MVISVLFFLFLPLYSLLKRNGVEGRSEALPILLELISGLCHRLSQLNE